MEDNATFCPNCGAPAGQQAPQQPQFQQPQFQQAPQQFNAPSGKHPKEGLSIIFGIIGLVLAVLGGILFGFIASLIGLACGVFAAILAVNIKKETNNVRGGAQLVVAILAIAFGAVFVIGCLACGYGVYGVATISCAFQSALGDYADAFGSFF